MQLTLPLLKCALAAFLLLGLQPATAQVNVTFRTLGAESNVQGIKITSGNRQTNLQATSGIIGGNYQYTGPNPMVLYRGRMVDGKEQLTPVGSVQFGATAGQPATGRYLVVLYNTGGDKVGGAAMPDSDAGFPAGSVRIFNAANLPLTVSVNDQKNPLPYGQFKVSPLPNAERIELRIYMTRSGETVELTNNVFGHASSIRRTIVLLLKNAEQMRASPDVMPHVEMIEYYDDMTARGNQRGPRE